jgi:hypothetical protein
MTEPFLLLFAAGIMLAAAVPGRGQQKQVTLNWLRLAGIIALALVALAWYFAGRRDPSSPWMAGAPLKAHYTFGGIILGQLAFTQIAWRRTQRVVAAAAFVCGVWIVAKYGPAVAPWTNRVLTGAGVAAMTGLNLMDMLLGHAYLTTSKMTMKPFQRLNLTLIGALFARAICAVGLVVVLQHRGPVEMLWSVHGFIIGVRWVVGLLLPAVFLFMTQECIRRRATQSATGILYVTGLLILIGEIAAMYLLTHTGLPF